MQACCLGVGRRALAVLSCVGALAWTASVSAQDAPDELARRHFDSGAAYLEESDYENALRAFQKAYDLSKRPPILLNIATVHERRGDLRAAIASLEAYLQAEPNGEHAETTRLRIQNLAKRLEETAQPTPTPAPSPAPAPAPQPVAAAPPPPPKPTPGRPSRVPMYIAFGVGGAGALTAIVTGILANSEYQDKKDSCSPRCTDDDVSSGRTLAVVSTIATGVAIAGAGVGVTLLLTAPSTAGASAPPTLRIGMGPRGPTAEASVSF